MLTCQFEDGGKTTNLRHVSACVILVRDGKVLLGLRGTYNNGKPLSESEKWGLLGGFFNRDETLEEAAKREAMEESGWEIGDLKLFRINDNPNRPAEDRQVVDIIFVANPINQVADHDEEVSNLEWFDLDKLPPRETIAFDHWEHLEMYRRYLRKEFPLPLLGKIDIT